MTPLDKEFYRLMGAGLDISEHLGLLHGLALDPNVKKVVEIGFREGVSATALAMAGKELHCIDIDPCKKGRGQLEKLGVKFTFYHGSSIILPPIPCDLLHIDGLHTHEQLLEELKYYAPHVSNYIVMHDTTKFAGIGQDGKSPGLWKAIMDFFATDSDWIIKLRLHNNNGLTILQRL